MTTGNLSPSQDTDIFAESARTMLGVSAEASADDLQQTFFRKLEASGFLPDEALQGAFLYLAHHKLEADNPFRRSVREEIAEQLGVEIEAFADQIFALDKTERTARWQSLWNRSGDVTPLRLRLLALAPGLEVNVADVDRMSPDTAAFARDILRTFSLDWPMRSAERRRILHSQLEARESTHGWKNPGKELRKTAPEIAALAPILVGYLDAYPARKPKREVEIVVAVMTNLLSYLNLKNEKAVPVFVVLAIVSIGIFVSVGSVLLQTDSERSVIAHARQLQGALAESRDSLSDDDSRRIAAGLASAASDLVPTNVPKRVKGDYSSARAYLKRELKTLKIEIDNAKIDRIMKKIYPDYVSSTLPDDSDLVNPRPKS